MKLIAGSLFAAASVVGAQSTSHSVYIDLDSNPATGCTTAVPGVTGIEARLTATVSGQPPIVSAVARQDCVSGVFGPAQAQPAGYPVGLNNGTGGADVIEMATALQGLGNGGPARLVFVSSSATGQDIVTANGFALPGSGAVPAQLETIPTLGWLGLVLLVALALWFVRKHPTFGSSLALLLLLGAGLVWAANFVTDGEVGDWAGVPPLATDAANDVAEGPVDLVAVFAAVEAGRLFVRLDVRNAQDASPVANAQAVTLNEDGTITITLTGSDPEGAPLTFAISTPPTRGTLSAITPINATSASVVYTPGANQAGSDSFSFTVADNFSTSTPAAVSITITGVDDVPTAVADTTSLSEDVPPTAIAVLANDTDVDAGSLTITAVTQPANGTVVITGGGSGLTYQPVANFCGTDTFTYTLNGGSTATVTVTVTCVDDAPTAVADAATVAEDAAATAIPALANDTNADGGPLSIASVTQPTNGTVVITGGGTGLTYAPAANFCSAVADTFTYTVNGGSSATVSVTVTCADDGATAVNDAATVQEDAAATPIDVLANDTDADGGLRSVASVTQSANGTVVITGGGSGLTYQPAANFCGTDTFTYTLVPGGSSATVTVTVTCVIDDPTAVNDTATVAEDASATPINVLANELNPDSAAMTVTAVTQPANGTATFTAANVSYAPAANFCGTDSFTYAIAPGGSGATVTVTVTCVDDAPTAVNDSASVVEDSGANAIDVLANDTNTDGGPLSIASVTQPTNGTVALTGGGTGLTYSPAANFCSAVADTFTYTVNGGSSATVSVTVTCADDGATAVNDVATVAEDAAATPIDVLANDTDADGGLRSVASVTQPANGTVVITGGGSGLTYQPALNFCGTDTFTYTLVPGGSTATVTVTVTCVIDDPTAVNDTATVAEDASATAIDVLANELNPDGAVMSIASTTQPANGTVVITGGGTGLTYAPDADYCNTPPGTTPDTFTYTLSPGATVATVSVAVTCSDDAPTAVNDAATVVEDALATAIDVLANDTDGDAGPISVASATQPTNGTVVITGGGTGLSYTPSADYCNDPPGTTPDTFTYTLAPGGDTATVSVTVTCQGDNPVAVADSATVAEDSAATAIDVLANDTDIDGGTMLVQSVSQPANGTVVITGGGTGLTYAPSANYCNTPPGTTPDTFTYTLNGASTATVSVGVTCSDDAPVAVDDAATVTEDSGANSIAVLANDTDGDGGPISISAVTQPANGTVVITGGGTGVTYQPNANFCSALADTFTYTLTPGGDTATVSVTVTCVDDAPTAVNDSASVTQNTGANPIAVLANDTDTDGGPLSVASVTQPANGAVVITGGGTGLTYQPTANYCNTPPGTTPDTFTYTLNGGSTATVSVSVSCDAAPVAVNDAATVAEDAAATAVNVLANDTDVDGGPKSVASLTQPANGTAVITGGGTGLTYQPNANYCNAPPSTTLDTFTYTLAPGGSTATVSITVTCSDDAPVAVADSVTVNEDAAATAVPVLTNDTDVDGGPKSVASVTQPANGTVVITGGGTGLTYQPTANYCNTPPGNTLDTFTYTLNGGSSTTVAATVNCVDDIPVAVADAATVLEDAAATAVAVLANDTDPDAGAISITSVTQPANGIVVITGGGTGLTYQPNANYCNTPPGTTLDTFTYTLAPGGSTTTVTMTVTCVDDPPVAVADAATVNEDSGANAIPVLTNDTDIDAGPKSVASVTQPGNGTVVITGGGTGLTYAPNSNFCTTITGVPDSFTYTLSGGSSTTVTMTVTCLNDPPAVANPPSYPVTTNIAIVQPDNATTDLLGSARGITDIDSAGPFTIAAASQGPRTSVQGGNVNIAADGSFTYNPPLNVTGADSIVYQVCDAGNPAPAACTNVTLGFTISGTAIVFVNASAPAGGNGRLQTPVQTVAAGVTALAAGGGSSNLFLFSGTYAQTATQVLPNNLRVFGAASGVANFDTLYGLTSAALSIARPALSQAAPVISSATVACVQLGQNNTLRGFTIGNCEVDALVGTNFGTLTVPDDNLVINNGTDRALNLTNGTAAATFTSVSSSGSAAQGINLVSVGGSLVINAGTLSTASGADFAIGAAGAGTGGSANVTYAGSISDDLGALVTVQNATGGTKTFSGPIEDGNDGDGAGITLTANAGATIVFNGGLTLSTGANPAFVATGAGTVRVCDDVGCSTSNNGVLANSLSTTTGTPLTLTNVTLDATGVELRSISSAGAAAGLLQANTGAVGRVSVRGNGGVCTLATPTCTGGSVANATGSAISVTSAVGPDLSLLRVLNSANSGITGTGVTGLRLDGVLVEGAGDADNEAGIFFAALNSQNLIGSVNIANSTVHAPADVGMFIHNYGGTLNLTVTNSTFSGTDRATPGVVTGDDLVRIIADVTASTTATVTARFAGNTLDQSESDGIAGIAQASTGVGGGILNITIDGNTFTGDNGGASCPTGCNDNAIAVQATQDSSVRFTIQNNNIQNQRNFAVGTRLDNTADGQGTIQNNTIGTLSSRSASLFEQGIFVANDDNSDMVVRVHNNVIGSSFWQGIWVTTADGSGGVPRMDATVTNNTTRTPVDSSGTYLPSIDFQATTAAMLCANVRDNSAQPGQGSAGSIDLLQFDTATFRLEGLPAATNNASAFMASRNPLASAPVYALAAGPGGQFTPATCRLPVATPTPP